MVDRGPKRLRSDPLFALRADYSADRGIPLSEFLAWDESDQDVALMWMSHRRQVHRCGTHPDEWNDERGGSSDAYHATVVVCPGCQRLEAAQADLDKRRGNEALHGAHVTLVRGPAPSGEPY